MQNSMTETEIKMALNKGLITLIEAREMLRMYLHKDNFTPIVNKSIKVHYVA